MRFPDQKSPQDGGTRSAVSDRVVLASGAVQNLLGILIAGVALFAIQILTSRTLGPAGFGIVTVLSQVAFVASFATRAGMDMAVVREVAIDIGSEREGMARATVARAAWIAAIVSIVGTAVALLLRDPIEQLASVPASAASWTVSAAALGIPFIALTSVWLGATRALKIMRYTLYIFWTGQNLAWILLSLLLWQLSATPRSSITAYSLSWFLAAIAAAWSWRREARIWPVEQLDSGWLGHLVRFAAPRAPASLLAQLLFWTDLFIVTRYVDGEQVGIYSAALRSGQILLLFLMSVNLIFAPFVADLHARGQRDRLDELFKTLTRWIVAGTLPLLLLIVIAPDEVLALFGSGFEGGRAALLIVLFGQFLNSATGSGGLVLIMVGRTGYDLAVYAGSFAVNVALALWLSPTLGITGAAIANAATFALSNAARLVLVKRMAGIQPYDARYGRLLLPAAAGAGVMWLIHGSFDGPPILELALTAALGFAAYGGALVAVGLTSAERRGLTRTLGRLRPR
ncbi:MAG: oligosaccharide flippase family protein [Actinomycetota bacterium]